MFATVKLTDELANAQRKRDSAAPVCIKQIPRVGHVVQRDCILAGEMTFVGILENCEICITKTGHKGLPVDLSE